MDAHAKYTISSNVYNVSYVWPFAIIAIILMATDV
jgi:hypothetical protein